MMGKMKKNDGKWKDIVREICRIEGKTEASKQKSNPEVEDS